jgi:hypothetical protein
MMMAKSFSWRSLANLHEYTKLLIHSNSTDGSTTFTDSSDSGHTVSVTGGAQHDTDQYKFSPTSILFDGNTYLPVQGNALMLGWIDEFRLVKGKAMWTKDFVPPAGRYG